MCDDHFGRALLRVHHFPDCLESQQAKGEDHQSLGRTQERVSTELCDYFWPEVTQDWIPLWGLHTNLCVTETSKTTGSISELKIYFFCMSVWPNLFAFRKLVILFLINKGYLKSFWQKIFGRRLIFYIINTLTKRKSRGILINFIQVKLTFLKNSRAHHS